jgi:hypothetical protein
MPWSIPAWVMAVVHLVPLARLTASRTTPRLARTAAALGSGVHGIVGSAGPERVLVDLEALVRHASEYHGPQPAVPDWQRLGPLLCGAPVPQGEGVIGPRRLAGEADGE